MADVDRLNQRFLDRSQRLSELFRQFSQVANRLWGRAECAAQQVSGHGSRAPDLDRQVEQAAEEVVKIARAIGAEHKPER